MPTESAFPSTPQGLEFLSNKFANMLKNLGVQKRDRVYVWIDSLPELTFACLGTLKFGAVFGAFPRNTGPVLVKECLQQSEAKLFLVAAELKETVDAMRSELPDLWHVVVLDKNKVGVKQMGAGDFLFEDYFASAEEKF